MEPTLTVTNTGFLTTIDGVSYVMEWIDKMLKVTGPDVCYYILETARGLEQVDCHFQIFTLLIPN
jgi:hypothetical protein